MREWVLLVLVIISIPFVLKRPLLGMAIYLGATVVRPEMIFWGSKTGSYVFMVYYITTFVGMLLRGDFVTRFGQAFRKETVLMIWLFGAILLSVMMAQYEIFRGYYYVFEFFKTFGICVFLFLLVNDLDDFRKIQSVMIGCFSFVAVWGIDQHFRGNERLEGLGGSAWGDSNGVAATFILFMPVALSRAFASERRSQYWFYMGLTALMVALIICTQSRAGLIGLVVSLAVFAFYSRKPLTILKIIAVFSVAVMPFATQQYLDRMQTMAGNEEFQGSASDRITLWKAGLMVFADNPLVGTGFLTYPVAKMKYEDRFPDLEDEFRGSVFRPDSKKVTHNTYIQLLSDCGIIGALPFILLISGGISLGLKTRKLFIETAHDAELFYLCGLCAGITGFAVCILSIDAAMSVEIYVQIVLAAILYRLIVSKRAQASIEVTTGNNLDLATQSI